MIRVDDDMKRTLTFGTAPKRVVSLVPSDTFTVAALGCGGALVGRTDYCELPAEIVAGVPSVGGTKNPKLEAILDLSPDLVIANQEENTKKDLETLAQKGVKVFVAFPRRAADGIAHLARLARVFHVAGDRDVRELIRRGYEVIREAEEARQTVTPLRTFCPIWMKPLMTIHGATFISDILDLAGAQNVFADRERRYPLAADIGGAPALPPEAVAERDTRYPRVTLDEVTARKPELVLLPDEPHPFSEEDAEVFRALEIPAAERGAVVRTGGKDLCWYGAQTVTGLPRVRALVERYRSA
ncbi:MAG: ABC transporter substrate-binding protein [Myxococcales bacterium 68-20]|nr:ABC transporter substrate-binding protein [Myxococcales bacterium]OJY16960.1 MAG: ABC transporter substrate-binding protein [Myxococcales bacterium 68-20]